MASVLQHSDIVRDHFEHPRNVGSFAENDPTVGTGWVGAPALGNVIKLQIKVSPQDVIVDARFKAYGGVTVVAASSWISIWVKGKTLAEVAEIHNTWLAEKLVLPPTEVQSAVCVERALQAALADFWSKAQANAN